MYWTLALLSLMLFGSESSDHATPLRTGTESSEFTYSITEKGCEMNGKSWKLYGTLSVDDVDHCIKYLCTNYSVIVMEQSSGCFDGHVCKYGSFVSGCNTFLCVITGRTHTRANRVHVTKEVAFFESERCHIYDEKGCFFLHRWHYFTEKRKRCYCDSSIEVKCEDTGPPHMGPGIMNYVN